MAASPVLPDTTRLAAQRWAPFMTGSSTLRKVRVFLAAGLVMLSGCLEEPVPTGPFPTEPALKQLAQEAPLDRTVERPHEAPFREISREIAGFGGYFYDEEGNMVVYLADPALQDTARGLLSRIIEERGLGRRDRSTGTILFRDADYSFLKLSAWRDRATHAVLDISGVEWTDLDEAQNRLVVGMSRPTARHEVASVLREHDIPFEAVQFEEYGPAVDLTVHLELPVRWPSLGDYYRPLTITLRDYYRPLAGGLQIQGRSGMTGTFGFQVLGEVRPEGELFRAFMTSGWRRPDDIYQPIAVYGPSPFGPIGYLVRRPQGWSCGTSTCRWSDAILVVNGDAAAHGKIARTMSYASGAGNSGSIVVDSSNPRMTITGEDTFLDSWQAYHKIGRTTGWTYGRVARRCVDHNAPGPGRFRLICQDWVEDMHADLGDGGSPVFRLHGNTATLAGILWGTTRRIRGWGDGTQPRGGEQYALVSAMWNIHADYKRQSLITH